MLIWIEMCNEYTQLKVCLKWFAVKSQLINIKWKNSAPKCYLLNSAPGFGVLTEEKWMQSGMVTSKTYETYCSAPILDGYYSLTSLEHPEKTKSFLQSVTDCWKVCRRCLYDDAINGLPLLKLRHKQMGLFWAWKRIQWVGMATVGPTHMNAQLPRRNRRDFLMTLLLYLSAPSINSSLNSRYVMATNLQNGPSIWYAVQHSSNWNKRMQYGVLSWS